MGFTYTYGQGADPVPPHETQQGYIKQLIIKTNGQNTTNKRGSPLAFLRRSSQGSSLPSSRFFMDTKP
ncbi:MAG: hypothetical protein ACJZ8C_03385 [Prochlorococcus marinus subsp. pastoris]